MGGPASHVELWLLWNGEQHGLGHGREHGHGRATSSRAACDSRWMGAVAIGRQAVLHVSSRACDGGKEGEWEWEWE